MTERKNLLQNFRLESSSGYVNDRIPGGCAPGAAGSITPPVVEMFESCQRTAAWVGLAGAIEVNAPFTRPVSGRSSSGMTVAARVIV